MIYFIPDHRGCSLDTLSEETFARRNFREFRVFWAFSRKFIPRNFSKDTIRESLYREIFQYEIFVKFIPKKVTNSLNVAKYV